MADESTIVIYDQQPTVIEVNHDSQAIVIEVDAGGGLVDSVNGKQGTVVLSSEDINFLLGTATVPLGGHRVVKLTPTGFNYADSSVVGDAVSVVGLTAGATTPPSQVKVITQGKIEEPSWNWMVGQPVYLSTNGLLTQTPPTTGFLLSIGLALTTTSILISLLPPIILA